MRRVRRRRQRLVRELEAVQTHVAPAHGFAAEPAPFGRRSRGAPGRGSARLGTSRRRLRAARAARGERVAALVLLYVNFVNRFQGDPTTANGREWTRIL